MPREYCFVCSSNEGVFLNIFTDGKHYRENIEVCLSLKVKKKTISSTKICHKCVYELEQCKKFLERYKKTSRKKEGGLCKKRGFCSLCMETNEKGVLFELWDENRSDSSLDKLRELFNINIITENLSQLSICLDCRYNLDVLFDLKELFKNTSRCLKDIVNGNMTSAEFPKTNTRVVKRTTTQPRIPKLITETPVPSKLSPQDRQCDECNVKIINGIDMYRYHYTGNTVCKECWMTIDPSERTKNRAHKVNNKTTKTKLCSVFLKDILSNSTEMTKEDNAEKEIEENEPIIIVSDDNDNDNNDSNSEEIVKKMGRLKKQKRKQQIIESKPIKRLKISNDKRTTRSSSVQSSKVLNYNSRQTRSESAGKSDTDEDNLKRNHSNSFKQSLATTSKITKGKRGRKSRLQTVIEKKNTRDKSISSISSIESTKPSKVRRVSSLSSSLSHKTNSKTDIDSDNNHPYKCKICLTEFENKMIGLTHELTHNKKLEVVLEKVSMPRTRKKNKFIEREPSTEFDSPSSQSETERGGSDFPLTISESSQDSVIKLSDVSGESDNNQHNQKSNLKIVFKIDETKKIGEEKSAIDKPVKKIIEDKTMNNENKNEENIDKEKITKLSDCEVTEEIPSAEVSVIDLDTDTDKNVSESSVEVVEMKNSNDVTKLNEEESAKKELGKSSTEKNESDEETTEDEGPKQSDKPPEENIEKNETSENPISQEVTMVNGTDKSDEGEKSETEELAEEIEKNHDIEESDHKKKNEKVENEDGDSQKSVPSKNPGNEPSNIETITVIESDANVADTPKNTEIIEILDNAEEHIETDEMEKNIDFIAQQKIKNKTPTAEIETALKEIGVENDSVDITKESDNTEEITPPETNVVDNIE